MPELGPEARERVSAAARDFLASELLQIEAEGLMPMPERDNPWIDRQRLWTLHGRASEGDLARLLVAEAPDRWPGPGPQIGAGELVEAFLRGAVASRTLEAWDPGRAPTTEALIDQFLDQVDNPDQPVRVLRLLTDLDVSEVEGRTVHDVRLRSVRGLPDTLQEEMYEAASEVRELRTMVAYGSREPRALLVGGRAGRDAWMVALELRPHLIHVSTAFRLVTGASIIEPLEVYGQPEMVHVGGPMAIAVDPDHASYWRRVGVVRPEQLAGVEAIAAQICELDERSPETIPPPIAVALSRFNRSHRGAAWSDVVIDIAIGLEAALSTGEKDEITLRIRSRAAHLLARPGDSPTDLFHDVGELLEIRGKVAHGDVVPPKRWAGLFEARGLTQVMVEDRMSVLFDRWRDVLRRAILARLLLASGGGSWTLRRPPKAGVDATLIGPLGRLDWRRIVRRRAAELGIASAIDRPSPLRDFLHEPYSDSFAH
jgi:hypothetical protein